ncbi:DUF520 family protein [Streptomyces halstedii]|uniref:DUF520 family protein n=1 Tax=Streptomyces halstedii TaxID=1944 RepID=UPI003F4E268E
MPSFDVVSELDKHEVTNAVDNAVKELDRRYDLRGKGTFELKELTVHLDLRPLRCCSSAGYWTRP